MPKAMPKGRALGASATSCKVGGGGRRGTRLGQRTVRNIDMLIPCPALSGRRKGDAHRVPYLARVVYVNRIASGHACRPALWSVSGGCARRHSQMRRYGAPHLYSLCRAAAEPRTLRPCAVTHKRRRGNAHSFPYIVRMRLCALMNYISQSRIQCIFYAHRACIAVRNSVEL